VISTSPKVHSERPDKVDFRILYTRDAGLKQVEQELEGVSGVTVREIFAEQSPAHAGQQKEDQPQYRSASSSPHLIRIELEDLDRLIASTHQLFRETKSCLDEVFENIPNSTALKAKVAGVDRSFLSLASELVNLRMVPIDRVLQRALRAGRSVAASAGKQVDFRVQGNGLRIDKSLSDAIADPLIHLVRNAVDHGIESADERVRLGKERRGTVSIEASSQQGQTRIKVTDDDNNDPEVVWNAGKRLGVVSEEQKRGIDQSLRLIFRPGFTTATSISETSGRGVGLDVVETTIEEVGGAIRVNSTPAVGSVFEIRLPVTFSLLDVVVIKAAGHRYLIDAAQVARVGERGVSTLVLDKMLGQENVDAQSPVFLKFGKDIVLQVNELIETEQVLVRNLGSRGGRWFGVAGAAEMHDGKVALLLDLPALVARYRAKPL
jgi:two-component system chemotaxis sensor kinase CheA